MGLGYAAGGKLVEALQQDAPVGRRNPAEAEGDHRRTQDGRPDAPHDPAEIGLGQFASHDRDHEADGRSDEQRAGERHQDGEQRDRQHDHPPRGPPPFRENEAKGQQVEHRGERRSSCDVLPRVEVGDVRGPLVDGEMQPLVQEEESASQRVHDDDCREELLGLSARSPAEMPLSTDSPAADRTSQKRRRRRLRDRR